MCCIAAVMFLLDDVDDVFFNFIRWARKKLNSPMLSGFVCITPSSILRKTVLDIK